MMWYIFEKEIVQGPQKQCSQVKNKNLKNLENLENLENKENQENQKKQKNLENLQGVFLTGPAQKSSKCWGWQNSYQKSESGPSNSKMWSFDSDFHFFGRDFASLNT